MKRNYLTLLSVLTLSLVLAGCGPKKPAITAQQIEQARNDGTLINLYEKVQADLAKSSGSSKESLQKIANDIAEQLAQDKQRKIYQDIENNRLPSNVVSMSLLEQLRQDAEPMKSWDDARYQQTRQKLMAESTLSQDALAKQMIKVAKIPVSDQVKRINAMSVAANIAGEGSQAYQDYTEQKEKVIVDWMVRADNAIAARKYTHAASFLRKVLGLDPDNAEAKDKLAISEQEGFENSFRKALEDSKPELAMSELERISKSPLFEKVKPTLTNSISLLNDFFVNRALQNASQGALKGAYHNFSKARRIREIMGNEPQHKAEQDYLTKLINFANVKGRNKEYGQQLAYLEVANKFNPRHPKLQSILEQSRKEIVAYAATSMFVEDFEQTGTHHSAGKSVAKQVYSWVFKQMPGEVILMSAEQIAQADRESPGRLLTLEGDVLQTGVDSESSQSKKKMRVVTETIRTPNPEYKEWKEDKSDKPAPAKFLIEEKKEDVTINVLHQRKTGILSVNYRLIDQKTGQILINETAREKLVLDGEGNEGISIGEFDMPFKRPELPSDIEMMEKMSTAVAQKIGDKLKSLLKEPDVRYEKLGDTAASKNNHSIAAKNYAYAAAIRGIQNQLTPELREKLISSIMEH
ncbi:hypothetical protein [Pleionea sediminis]|uniref:hypothetical protein n=1 Tax=Pleionea sediminis TaxID=2569479 RepID=UPI0011862ABF|nr:hypothetical protein [Pleionea sediminis]